MNQRDKKRNYNRISFIIISLLILFIPFIIEKFYYPNEIISIPRFLFLESLCLLFVIYLLKNDFNIFNLLKKNIKTFCDFINNLWNHITNHKYFGIIFKFLPKNIFVFILFIISICTIYKFYINNNDYMLYSQTISDAITGPIIDEPLDISFANVKVDVKPSNVCLLIGTYGKKIDSEYRYELYHMNNLVYSENFSTNELTDNSFKCFSLNDNAELSTINEYNVKIVPVKTDMNNIITLYKNSETNEIAMYFIKKQDIVSFKLLLLVLIIMIFLGINYYINNKKTSVEKMFIIYCLFYVLPILLIMPPYQVPDEPYHFYNSYQLSQIDFKNTGSFIAEGNVVVPKNMDCIDYSKLSKDDMVFDVNSIGECFNNEENIVYKLPSNYLSPDHKIAYFVSGIGIKLADIFCDSPIIIFFVGRLLNCLLSMIIVYFAIKIAPKYKEIFLSLGLMPMFIQQAISYSYDSLLNSICLLIIALILGLTIKNKDRVNIRYYLLLVISSIIIINIKAIYLPLLFLLIATNDGNFNEKKYNKYIYLILCVLISFIISYLITTLFSIGYDGPSVIRDTINYNNILHNPLLIFTIANNTINKYGMIYLNGLFGYFGWFRFKMDDFFVYAYIAYFIYLIISNNGLKINKLKRLVIFLGILLILASVFGALYFEFTAPNSLVVDGVQGRYFIPVLAPLLIILMPNKNKIKRELSISYNFVNIVLLQYILMLIIFYY